MIYILDLFGVVAVAVTLTVRLAAIHWKLSLPVFAAQSEASGGETDRAD